MVVADETSIAIRTRCHSPHNLWHMDSNLNAQPEKMMAENHTTQPFEQDDDDPGIFDDEDLYEDDEDDDLLEDEDEDDDEDGRIENT